MEVSTSSTNYLHATSVHCSLSSQTVTIVRSNVGVDRHAVALRREAYAHLHDSRRNAAACPCRTTCYTQRCRSSQPDDTDAAAMAIEGRPAYDHERQTHKRCFDFSRSSGARPTAFWTA